MTEPMTGQPAYAVVWQYCRDGYDTTAHPYAEDDADTVRAWAGDLCLAEIHRDGYDPGRWRVHTSDLAHLPDEVYDALSSSPSDALGHLAELCQFTYTTAQPDQD